MSEPPYSVTRVGLERSKALERFKLTGNSVLITQSSVLIT